MEDKYHREIPPEAKLQAILAVWSKEQTVTDVCRNLQISRQTFYDWENAVKQQMQTAVEPQQKGRNPKDLKEREEMLLEIQRLKQENKQIKQEKRQLKIKEKMLEMDLKVAGILINDIYPKVKENVKKNDIPQN